MGKLKIIIPSNDKYLFGQTIEIDDLKNEIKILVGIGMLNSNDELSINIPLDFLMIVESLLTIKSLLEKKNKTLFITIWIGDKNAEICTFHSGSRAACISFVFTDKEND